MKPKIRLKGFEGEWEEKPLRQICFKESSSIAMDSLGLSKGEYPLFGASGYIQNIEYYQQEKPYVGIVKDGAGVGRANLYPAKSSLLGTMQYILPKTDTDVGFLGYLINKTNLSIYNTGSTIPHIYFKDYGEQPVTIPSFLEQQSIANYFKSLDELIQSTTQKVASLKQLKEASLISMFPQGNETTPRVRFKGFEGEWEIKSLSCFSKKVIKKNANLKYKITLTNSADYGIINQLDFFDHDISNEDNTKGYYVVENDDFVYNPRISSNAPVGPINRNQLGYTGVMSPLYYVFRVDGINKDFLSWYFSTNLWHKFMKDNGNSGARYDRLSITDEVFVQMPITFPSNIHEQQHIASYFNALDTQITLQEQRLEKLKQLKSACLDQMFV